MKSTILQDFKNGRTAQLLSAWWPLLANLMPGSSLALFSSQSINSVLGRMCGRPACTIPNTPVRDAPDGLHAD